MQKKINQILEGNFDYENGSLDFSCAKIELSVKKGEIYEGSFHIYAPQDRFCSGSITSSDLRMECITTEFIGSEEEIIFCFHGEKVEEGDVVKGCFNVVSNQGEYYLPFVVSVEHRVLESSIGPIRNLFHFANLAKSNWREALELFYCPDFTLVFNGTDAGFKDTYRALSVYPMQEQNMEEFLMQINKKQKIGYLIQEDQLYLEMVRHSTSDSLPVRNITIVRNGWGYNRLYVECTGSFLYTEKAVLTDADFVGNKCVLPVYFDTRSCGNGKTYGEVRIYNAYQSMTVPVTVSCGDGVIQNPQRLTRKRISVHLMEIYCAFRTKKISTATWMKETGKLVQRLVTMDENDIPARLFQAQLLITEGSMNEAGWILDHVADLMEKKCDDDSLYAYYLYLSTLIHHEPEYVDQVTADVEKIYHKNTANWRVAWLLIYLSEEYHKSASAKWLLLMRLFETGCTSPAIYLEAVSLLNNNPALLQQLGLIEMQILWYGIKKEIVKAEVVEQFLMLLDRTKGYSDVLYYCLEKLYDKSDDVRILQQICSLLIKGNRTGIKYFKWYQAGIDNKLRITNIYEYYMLSMNLQEKHELSKEVLLYFSYQCNLDYEHTAYIYYYILQNEDRLKEIVELYKPRMERFCTEQILKMHINRHLGFVYGKLLKTEMITEQLSHPLSYLVYANSLQVSDATLRKVLVYQTGNRVPEEYQIVDGKAWISLYGNDYTIVFEDAYQNRFIKNVDYTLEKLMMPGKLSRILAHRNTGNPQFEFYMCKGDMEGSIQNDEEAVHTLRIIHSDYVQENIRKRLSMNLLQYYHSFDKLHEMGELLSQIDSEGLSLEERSEIIRYMLICDKYDLARQWMEEYGPYFIDAKLLVRLLTILLEKTDMEEQTLYVAAAFSAFQRGKYDSTILTYLMRYYKGLTKTLRDIWKAAKSFELDCYVLDESLLVQMLYSGAFVGEKMEIFQDYLSQGPKIEIEQAFLMQCAYEYFARDQVTAGIVFDEILRMHYRGEALPKVCKLALVKYYAENRTEMNPAVETVVEEFLKQFFDEGIYLEQFREFRRDQRVIQEMADKTIVEYKTDPNVRVSIHYVISHESGESEEYTSEYMKEVYRGVYFKELVLFFGECLQYYITEEMNGVEQLTESGTVQKSDIVDQENESRYSLINDIVISKALEDFDTMESLLEEYYRKDYLSSRLFEIK